MEARKNPRIAILGYGYWGPNIARNVAELESASLAAVCDSDERRLHLARRRHPLTRTTSDERSVIYSPEIDAVVITTPVGTHYALARAALLAGKHVLVSKPLTTDVMQAEELVSLADEQHLALMVDHTFIYTGAVRELRNLVDTGALGDVYYVDSSRQNLGLLQTDVNVVWDLAPHDVSILLHLLQVLPTSVIAVGARHVSRHEEIAFITLKFPGDRLAHINVSWLAPVKVRTMVVAGSRRMAIYDDTAVVEKVRIYDHGVEVGEDPEALHKMLVEYRTGDVHAPHLDPVEALAAECRAFVDAITKGASTPSDGRAGLDVVRVLDAATRSMANGGMEVRV
jgi:predicted dehydrogenase